MIQQYITYDSGDINHITLFAPNLFQKNQKAGDSGAGFLKSRQLMGKTV